MKTAANSTFSRVVALAAILLLLLQVQTVFACEMMEHSGPVSECCCEHMAAESDPDCDCCSIDTRVSLKAEGADQQPLLPAAQFTLELPQLAPSPAQWPPILAPPEVVPVTTSHRDPSHPGSRTWLATLRLRI